MKLRGKPVVLILISLLLIVGLFLTLRLVKQRQENRSRATAATTLSFSPTSSSTTPLVQAAGSATTYHIMINPGTNQVSYVGLDIGYDATKFASVSFTPNTSVMPVTLQGPIYSSGRVQVNISTGSDTSKVITAPAEIGTLTMTALSQTQTTVSQVVFNPQTSVLSVASTDNANENVLSSSTPLFVQISSASPSITLSPTPTSTTCTPTGGNGGAGIAGPGVSVKGGDGGTGSGGGALPCKPGTNGYTVDASNYCSGHSVLITWPTTNTATYYKLAIDGTQVQNGTGLSYSATNYSVGPQHTITLTAGNTTVGDFSPSTGGYFQISSTACTAVTPTISPSPVPSSTPTPTSTPIPTNTPTPTPTPVSTKASITLLLHGIGSSGDNANPTNATLSNKNPLHPTRQVSVLVYDANNVLLSNSTSTVTYNSTAGNFTGTVDLGTGLTNGPYIIKIKTDQYLRALVPGIQTLTAGTTNVLPTVTLVAGDTNNDNALNILDYNTILGCYSDITPATSCTAAQKAATDLNDDGLVNQIDYNLFLRELSVQTGV